MTLQRLSIRLCCLFPLLALAACNLPTQADGSLPTPNVTQAYQTVEAHLTAASQASPVATTPAPTDTGLATPTATTTVIPPSATLPRPTSIATQGRPCDQAAAGSPLFDVTIPDDSQMAPGQSFTKTWRLQNAGSCTWSRSYAVTFFSGEQLSAPPSVGLNGDVLPGQTVDVSVDMTAPQTPGIYQSNWKLRNAANVLFGIGPTGSAPFWVRIVVVANTTITPTPVTATPTATLTPAPAVQSSGSITLNTGSLIDLDTKQVNAASGNDLSYESNAEGRRLLVPQGSMQLAVFGPNPPGFTSCTGTALGTAPVDIEAMAGSYLCYRTTQGLPGRLQVTAMNPDNFSLTLDFLTWSIP
jgi:hypothetical protein